MSITFEFAKTKFTHRQFSLRRRAEIAIIRFQIPIYDVLLLSSFWFFFFPFLILINSNIGKLMSISSFLGEKKIAFFIALVF